MKQFLYVFFSKIIVIWILFGLFYTLTSASSVYATESKKAPLVRDTICLNGLWNFLPEDGNQEISKDNMGLMWVPGSWHNRAWWANIPGIEQEGTGWDLDYSAVNRASYLRTIYIPEYWTGKKIIVEFDRISTDAIVHLDGQPTDTIGWPGGGVDITDAVIPGAEHSLEVLVLAIPSQEMAKELMGTATTQARLKKQSLSSRGIIGDVFLKCLPETYVISDVFVNTSVRKKEIVFQIEMETKKAAGQLENIIEISDSNGNLVKSFEKTVDVNEGNPTKCFISGKWEDPLLWDLDQPNVYTASVMLFDGKQLVDKYTVEFGFREFWIEGKDFFLNNKKINLRPKNYAMSSGMNELVDAQLDGFRKAGFNFIEMWPSDISTRGHIHFNNHFVKRASKKGMLASVTLPPSTPFIMDNNWEYSWEKPGMKEEWEEKMIREIKKLRNEPSIVMWVMNPNFFGNSDDQNPYVIGRKGWNDHNLAWKTIANAGKETIRMIKNQDPTRPVFFHHGAYVGDVHTMNHYMNLSPLQEREEWMSHYSKHGDMPYMAIEFGTPLECTMLRGRIHFGANQVTEPLFTEFCAIYQGNEAYTSETNAYREEMKAYFLGGQKYKFWQNNKVTGSLPSFQQLQKLFIENTWQSWRTYGISGGMNPWNNAHGFEKLRFDSIRMPAFNEGRTGTYFKKVSMADMNYWNEDYWDLRLSAKTLIENNRSTLAYIAGQQGNFTEKKHGFFEDEQLRKQIILINDSRNNLDYKWSCVIKTGNEIIAKKEGEGIIGLATVEKIPVHIELPVLENSNKRDGEIILEAVIGGTLHRDTFNYRVFTSPEKINGQLSCFDPRGLTKTMLEDLGLQISEWNGKDQVPLLVIGREVLSSENKLPGNIHEYVKKGGKLLVMSQKRNWFEEQCGFRTARHQSRYVYPVSNSHPVIHGLDKFDLRNWGGQSTIEEAYPDYLNARYKKGEYGLPYYGWHWGNQGTVSSVPIEKPHFSGWRPILECEFDLAYTPLMELDYGPGKIVMCTMDLEDYYKSEPAALLLTKNLISYMKRDVGLPNKQHVYYSGSETMQALLNQLGLAYEPTNDIPANAEMVILGHNSKIDERQLSRFLKKGGSVICLNQENPKGLFQTELSYAEKFYGSLDIPDWNELEGLSPSDMRWRTTNGKWLLKGGCDIACDGMVGKKEVGKGTALFIQIDPDGLNADSLTYFRYTRWRQYRAMAQILTNMGCRFKNDDKIFDLDSSDEFINLEGRWFAKLIDKSAVTLSVITDTEDKGMSSKAAEYIKPEADVSAMEEKIVPMKMESYGGEWSDANGEAVFRKTIDVPASMLGKDLELQLGVIDDFDETYFNGQLVGKIDQNFHEFWGYERKYIVPASLVKPGKNVIAIRVYDRYGNGGLLGFEKPMVLKTYDNSKKSGYYHPDYLTGFTYGDDPYRYFRW